MEKKNKDFISGTVGYQIIFCAFVFLIMLLLGRTGSETVNKAFSDIRCIISSSDGEKAAENTFKSVIEVISSDSGALQVLSQGDTVVNSIPSQESTVQSEKGETGETTASSSEEAASNNGLTATVPAEGGRDNDTPDNVSQASYTLSRQMIRPVSGEYTSLFGKRIHPVYGTEGYHTGIDIAAECGTAIRAAFDGIVTTVKNDEWNGNYLKLTHDGGITTVYCHCEKITVKEGERVKAGECVATVGSTGISTGPHLHFELRINEISYDPLIALNCAADAV